MKGDFTLAVLELLHVSEMTIYEILDTLTYHGRIAHYDRLRGRGYSAPKHKSLFAESVAIREQRRRLSKLVSKLRAEGIVEQHDATTRTVTLTKRGKQKFETLKRREMIPLSIAKAAPTDEFKIIAFDIPETRRKERNWLRFILQMSGFKLLQESVFLGKIALPEEFFEELGRRGLLSCVAVLAVTKEGNLHEVHRP